MISVLLQHYEKARENGEPHGLYVVINGLNQREAEELKNDYEKSLFHNRRRSAAKKDN